VPDSPEPLILAIIALPAEARPLIEHWGLKRAEDLGRFARWTSDSRRLIISGVGPTAAAAATGALLATLSPADRKQSHAFNIGWAGSRRTELGVGTLCLVNRATGVDNGREWLPDILFRHALPEAAIDTHSRPVTTGAGDDPRGSDLVDMEASGFFEAAWKFLPPHRAQALKIVSDHLQGGALDRSALQGQLGQCAPPIDAAIQAACAVADTPEPALEDEAARLFEAIVQSARLTETQAHQLRDALLAAQIRGTPGIDAIKARHEFTAHPPVHKRERNRLVERLIEALETGP